MQEYYSWSSENVVQYEYLGKEIEKINNTVIYLHSSWLFEVCVRCADGRIFIHENYFRNENKQNLPHFNLFQWVAFSTELSIWVLIGLSCVASLMDLWCDGVGKGQWRQQRKRRWMYDYNNGYLNIYGRKSIFIFRQTFCSFIAQAYGNNEHSLIPQNKNGNIRYGRQSMPLTIPPSHLFSKLQWNLYYLIYIS